MLDFKEDAVEFIENDFSMKLEEYGKDIYFKNPIGVEITDDGMSPQISKNDKIILEFKKNYDIGDIVAYTTKKDKNIKVRTLTKNNDLFIMIPSNSNYSKELCPKDDIMVIGKVNQIIRKI